LLTPFSTALSTMLIGLNCEVNPCENPTQHCRWRQAEWLMSQPAPLHYFKMDVFNWTAWTKSFGIRGRIGLDLVDDFTGMRKMDD